MAPLNVAECFDEIALLLGGAGRESPIEVTLHMTEGEEPLQLEADRPRLSHALLRHCSSSDGNVRLSAVVEGDAVRIDVDSDAPAAAVSFSAEEFAELVKNAGGELSLTANRASLRFKRMTSAG